MKKVTRLLALLMVLALALGSFACAKTEEAAPAEEAQPEATEAVVEATEEPAPVEKAPGMYEPFSQSRTAAAKVKREAPITVVIGNPPYKDKANGKGAWIENGSANEAAKLADWQPPAEWGVEELRFGFPDSALHGEDIHRVIRVARWAHERWTAGDRVLIRCQAERFYYFPDGHHVSLVRHTSQK